MGWGSVVKKIENAGKEYLNPRNYIDPSKNPFLEDPYTRDLLNKGIPLDKIKQALGLENASNAGTYQIQNSEKMYLNFGDWNKKKSQLVTGGGGPPSNNPISSPGNSAPANGATAGGILSGNGFGGFIGQKPDNSPTLADLKVDPSQYYINASKYNIDSGLLQSNINSQAQQQKEQNVNAYNAAVASQGGVNPALSMRMMGNNLALANQQAAQTATNLNANLGYEAQKYNSGIGLQGDIYNSKLGMQGDLYNSQLGMQGLEFNAQQHLNEQELASRNFNASQGYNMAASEAAANRFSSVFGAGLEGLTLGLLLPSDEKTKNVIDDSPFLKNLHLPHLAGMGEDFVNEQQLINNVMQQSQESGNKLMQGMSLLGGALGKNKVSKSGEFVQDKAPQNLTLNPNNVQSPSSRFNLSDTSSSLPNRYSLDTDYFQSDEKSKNIQNKKPPVSSMFDDIDSHYFTYKPGTPGDDGGQIHAGIMAQDLEKSGPVGQSMVKEDPASGYKMINIPDAVSTLLASISEHEQKLNEIDKRLSQLKKGGKK